MRLCLQMPGVPLHPGAGPFQPTPRPDDMLWVCRRGRGCRTEEAPVRDLVVLGVLVAAAVLSIVVVMAWLARA